MSTVRRLYFYALSLISIEVVIWGVVSLLRTIVSGKLVGGGSLLATGLSLVLVGVPIFLLHWRTVQRDAFREPEERASRIRAIFFYAVLLGILVPIVYALLALLNRGLVQLLGQPVTEAWLGSGQTAWDNLIAIVINAVAAAYFWRALQDDWLANAPENFLADTRRLYRYLWVGFGLTLTIVGAYNLLRFLFYAPGQPMSQTAPILAGALTLLVIGAPIWVYTWRLVQASLGAVEERRSLLRLVVLYLISLSGVIGVLASAGRVLNALIRWLLGEPHTFVDFLQGNSAELGAAIPLAVMWWYYGSILNREVASMPDQPRRSALHRLYDYILSLLGLAVTYAGLLSLVEFLAQVAFARSTLFNTRDLLSGALSALLVGLPLWLLTWREMQREAARRDEAGDHARRSILRKAYLYLVLFLLVIGAMTFTGQLLFTLLDALLSGAPEDLGVTITRMFLSLLIDAGLLVYHWRALREDGRMAQFSLGNLHAAFPTLILTQADSVFADALVAALGRVAPRLPVAVHPVERSAPDDAMLGAKAVLLPVGLALDPPESLRLWLAEYQGRRLLIPLPAEGWSWLGVAEKQPQDLARETAHSIRLIAEGEAVRQALPSNPWSVAGYVLGGIFGLLLLSILFSLLVSSLFR